MQPMIRGFIKPLAIVEDQFGSSVLNIAAGANCENSKLANSVQI